MATAYPGALDATDSQLRTDIADTDDLDASGKQHDVMHVNAHGAVVALETKLGLTDSNAAANAVLVGTGTSTTEWTTSPTVTGTLTAGAVVAPLAINAQTGTTYTFVLADAGKLVTSSNGSAQTVTVPPNSSVAFVVGTQILVQNIGSANATLAEGSGVTINSKDDNKEIDGQYAAATLIKTATDAWSLIGALA
jgi:hypothetical protein